VRAGRLVVAALVSGNATAGHNARIDSRSPSRASPRKRRRGAFLFGIVLALFAAAAIATLVLRHEDAPPPPALAVPAEIVGPNPLAFDGDRTSAYERAAAFGLSHVLFAKSPGGVHAAARRTAAFRPLIEDAVEGSGIDAGVVEGLVFLESAGRPNVIAGDDPENAAGLTQILAETATNFLGMQVDLAASRRLTRSIADALRRGDEQSVERLQSERSRVDARFDPAQALAGTVRYLTAAEDRFGRDDLAVVSYHMGIGNLEGVLRAFAGEPDAPIDDVVHERDLSYARIYFDSSPILHREAWEQLASFGDDSQTYYWRVLGSREIMRLFREDPGRLGRLAELHGRGPSSERVLHPLGITPRFADAAALEAARRAGVLRPLPDVPGLAFEIGPRIGERAADLGADPTLYRMLRPNALRLLEYLTTQVRDLGGAERPLRVTSAVYDEAYAAQLSGPDVGPGTHASLHATGYTFDIRRRYASGAQAEAFQYTLERLEALGLIAWMRGERVIHVTVSPRARTRARAS
jgi:hypothetical protein